MSVIREETVAISGVLALTAAALIAGVGAVFAFAGQDEVIRLHGALIALSAIAAAIYVLSSARDGGDAERSVYFDGPI